MTSHSRGCYALLYTLLCNHVTMTALPMQALTSDDDAEITICLGQLKISAAGTTGHMHIYR